MVLVDQDLCPPRYRDPVWVSAGGMGDLYRAIDTVLDRPVAIKRLAERLAADQEVRKRFRREALAAARLSDDPNTVTIFDVGEWQGRPFIVMEYLSGGTLEQSLRHGLQPSARTLAWLEQAARALDAAHERGVVHRDVKPANLLLDEQGRVRVADFGIATAAGLDSFTQTGTILGTAGYLAPEQAQGRTVTSATDRYALGVVAFELLTGRRPFLCDSATAEAAAHVYAPVPSASQQNPALPNEVDAVFARALAKEPTSRFESCGSLVTALRTACDQTDHGATSRLSYVDSSAPTRMIRARRRSSTLLVGGVALALLVGGGLAVAVLGTGTRSAAPAITRTVTNTTTVTTSVGPAKVPAPSSVQSQAGPSDLNTSGYRLMQAGNYTAALPLLRRAVLGLTDPANPVTAYANFNLGQTLVRLGHCNTAMPYLQRAMQLERGNQQVADAIAYAQQCEGASSANTAADVTLPPDHQGSGKSRTDHGNPHD